MKTIWAIGVGTATMLFCSCESPKRIQDAELILDTFAGYRKEEIAGIWFGFVEADLYLYRVELVLPDSGRGAYSSSISGAFRQFAIPGWDLTGVNRLSIQFAPGLEVTGISGSLITRDMFTGYLYRDTGWSNAVKFYREEPFDERIGRLREIMGQR